MKQLMTIIAALVLGIIASTTSCTTIEPDDGDVVGSSSSGGTESTGEPSIEPAADVDVQADVDPFESVTFCARGAYAHETTKQCIMPHGIASGSSCAALDRAGGHPPGTYEVVTCNKALSGNGMFDPESPCGLGEWQQGGSCSGVMSMGGGFGGGGTECSNFGQGTSCLRCGTGGVTCT